MRLLVDIFEEITAKDLQTALVLLGSSREAVLLLSNEDRAEETFLRAVRLKIEDLPGMSDKFHVDRCDHGRRYECDAQLSLSALRDLLSAYLRGDATWGDAYTWRSIGNDTKTIKA